MAQFDGGCNEYLYPYPHDKDDKKFYSRTYRPNDWASGTEYKSGRFADVVIPATPNGWLYVCTSGGISGASEPTFGTVDNGTTTDNSVEWTAKPYTLLLITGDTITASTWTGTNGETIDNESIVSDIKTKFRLTAVPANATSATIINHITVRFLVFF